MSSYPRSNPLKSNWSVLNVTNGRPWNPKLALKENSLWIKFEAQDFASEVSNKHTYKIWRKKRSEFFDHSSTLRGFFKYMELKTAKLFCLPMKKHVSTASKALYYHNFAILEIETLCEKKTIWSTCTVLPSGIYGTKKLFPSCSVITSQKLSVFCTFSFARGLYPLRSQ